VVMARILCTENVDAEAEFVSERIESWKRRWEDCTPMDSVSELEGWAGCLIEELTGEFVKRPFITFAQMFNGVHPYRAGDPYELNEGTTNLFPVDVIDAGIVERRGPFRFVPTTQLDQHLSRSRPTIAFPWPITFLRANRQHIRPPKLPPTTVDIVPRSRSTPPPSLSFLLNRHSHAIDSSLHSCAIDIPTRSNRPPIPARSTFLRDRLFCAIDLPARSTFLRERPSCAVDIPIAMRRGTLIDDDDMSPQHISRCGGAG
jgi:hypothetical protein